MKYLLFIGPNNSSQSNQNDLLEKLLAKLTPQPTSSRLFFPSRTRAAAHIVAVRRPVAGRPRVTNPVENKCIAAVDKRNRRLASTRMTSMVAVAIGKTMSASTVR
ncbi:hypothetical protein TNCV_3528481 [Trichonephila clavipes]|nr:hypothetical protein TNCV_3528481 [Trichonephila clavipes]